MPVNGAAEMVIYDMTGRVMFQQREFFSKGNVNYQFTSRDLNAGTYFMSVRVGESEKHAKFVVVK